MISDMARLLGLFLRDDLARRMSIVMLCATLAIIAIFYVSGFWDAQSRIAHALHRNLGLGWDAGLAESFNHGMAFVAAFLLLLCYLQTRGRVFVFLTALYAYIWVDDSAQYHERVGEKLGEALQIPEMFGIGRQQYGEFLAWAFAGGVLLLLLLWTWRRRRPGDAGILLSFFLCFVLLVVCGIVVDTLHGLVPGRFDEIMQVFEDGGEMVAVTLGAALSLGVSRNLAAYYAGAAGADERAPSTDRGHG
ncbi:hypothetical protein [Antarcticimicrobium sediminis]|uniref:Uncharacterized protein n=1 Tax=Antarcticimicrobium sediminis TaxID=2546227 RepID=A0A4V2Z8M2_9RHOB|nr:hypothetical protein [Antarcticimicrobium sediminis]TDE40866.1 hypothetical protein E1B25_01215 [Antarcticimicrobium sediminis]